MLATLEPETALPAAEAAVAPTEDLLLLTRLRAGDEAAFVYLVEAHHASMVRLAMSFVTDRSVAEEVAQEAWLGVLKGIDRFEGRSSLKTWIFRILTNTAKTRGERESRIVPFSSLASTSADGEEVGLDLDRFQPEGAANPGHWWAPPSDWGTSPEKVALSGELRGRSEDAMAKLSPQQREVIRRRDIEGWASEEVCNVLNIRESNQRVLLHRARGKVRQALEEYFDGR